MTTKISATIIEDDFLAGINLKQLLNKQDIKVDNIYRSGEELYDNIDTLHSDIIIIDIKLEGKITGIEIGQMLSRKFPEKSLVYVTGQFDMKTVKSILNLNPACYIKKPYDETTLMVNINLVVSKIKTKKQNRPGKITIQEGQKNYRLHPSEILYVKSDGNYLEFYLNNNERFLIRKKLNEISKSEDFKQFVRTHSRFLINPNHMFHYSYRSVIVGETEIPISEKYRPELRKMFNN